MLNRNIRTFRKYLLALVIFAVIALALPSRAQAGTASGKVKAPADVIEVIIVESNSDFFNHIYKVDPGAEVFIGVDNATGTCVDDIVVLKNQEVVFEIRIFFPAETFTGDVWQSGPPSRNSDLQRHVVLTDLGADTTLVEFEDIDASGWGVADEPNFVDARFIVRPDTDCSAPLPPIPALP